MKRRGLGFALAILAVAAAAVVAGPGCNTLDQLDGVVPACATDKDCAHACDGAASCVCDARGSCVPGATCVNGRKDGAETDVDCGGPECARCGKGLGCAVNTDCVSLDCDTGGSSPVCASCQAGAIRVDCGGAYCPRCADDSACTVDSDCLSDHCDLSVSPPVCVSCHDGARNGDETGVDCGGARCPRCADTVACTMDGDCASGECDLVHTPHVCASCSNQKLDGTETDFDCGGARCPRCAASKVCATNGDCLSGNCDLVHVQHICIDCLDGKKDWTETDVDCGGGACPPCAQNAKCLVGADCQSGLCTASICN